MSAVSMEKQYELITNDDSTLEEKREYFKYLYTISNEETQEKIQEILENKLNDKKEE